MAERTRVPKDKVEAKRELTPEQIEKKEAKKAAKAEQAAKENRIVAAPPKTHVTKKGKKLSKVKFNAEEDGKVWFRKVGRGSLRKIPGCTPIIKPGEKFLAHLEDIPKAFRNSIVRVDQEKIKKDSNIQSVDMAYRIKKLTNGSFNVVNKKAKKMNTKPLSREEAIDLRNELND